MEPRFGKQGQVMLVNRGKDNVTTGKTFCKQGDSVKLVELSQSLAETSDVVSTTLHGPDAPLTAQVMYRSRIVTAIGHLARGVNLDVSKPHDACPMTC